MVKLMRIVQKNGESKLLLNWEKLEFAGTAEGEKN